MKSTLCVVTATLGLLVSIATPTFVMADDIAESSQRICKKVKSCGITQLEDQGIQPEMVEMMKSMFDGMCTTMVAPYIQRANDAGLEKKGIACLDAIEAMSCDELMNGEAENNEACQELEKAADEAGISTE